MRRYPDEPGDLLPTALGNCLRAFERRAGSAYGISAIRAWPRLYLVLPDPTKIYVDELRNQLDAAVRMAALTALGSLITAVLLVPHPVWLLLPAGLAALSLISYRASIAAAEVYGTAVTAAFDVHHLLLLEHFGMERPDNTDKERVDHRMLMKLFREDSSINVTYRP
jgi:hypothetical protein